MKRLLVLTALAVLTIGTVGCSRNPCRPGLFGRHRAAPACCTPASSPCGTAGGCNPCATGSVPFPGGVIQGPVIGDTVAPSLTPVQ